MSDRLDRLEQRIEETHAIAVAAQTAMDALCLELISDDLIADGPLEDEVGRRAPRDSSSEPAAPGETR